LPDGADRAGGADGEDQTPEFEGFRLTAVDAAGPGGPGFWRRIEHDGVVPEGVVRSAIRDLMPEEREESWARGPGAVGPPVRWERPHDIDEAVEQRNAQFVLRNLHRHEMDAWPHDLWWSVTRVRTTLAEAATDVERARQAGGSTRRDVQEALLDAPSYTQLLSLKQEHVELMRDTPWAEFDWRRGPRRKDG
jgi:hypothetical protein